MVAVSICCITYNQEKYISAAIESFLMQKTDFEFEILIHDDASTDRTAEIIREYEIKYPDIIHAIYQTENQYSKGITNPSGAFNFPRAKGRYIAMCEGDDYWTDERKLQKQFDYMEGHPECSFCLHSASTRTVDGSFTENMVRPYNSDRVLSPEEIIGKRNGYPTASLLFRTEYVRELPDYYTECPIGDIPLQLILAARGSAYYMDEPMSVYRIGDAQSWSVLQKQGDYRLKQERYYNQMKKLYTEYDKATGGRFHEVIEEAAERIRFLTYVNTREYDRIYSKPYKKFYRELSFRTRFFMRLECILPDFYVILRRIGTGKREI